MTDMYYYIEEKRSKYDIYLTNQIGKDKFVEHIAVVDDGVHAKLITKMLNNYLNGGNEG